MDFVTREIKSALRDIFVNKVDYLFLFGLFLVHNTGIKYLNTDEALIVVLITSILFYISKPGKSRIFTTKTMKILVVFLLLYLIPNIINSTFVPKLFLGTVVRILIAIFLIKYYSIKFLDFFENLVFILVLISIPLYTIQQIYPEFFDIFQPITFLNELREGRGHINLFIFHFSPWATLRNCGFTNEPANFAAYIALSMTINIFKNGFRINFRMVIYLIAMLTTLSIGGFIYLLILILAFLLENNIKVAVVVFPLLILFGVFISKYEFVQERYEYVTWKIDMYERSVEIGGENVESSNVSRNAGLLLDLKYLMQSPLLLGYGEYRNPKELINMATSPNGFGRFMIRWGIPGIILLYLSQRRLYRLLNYIYNNNVKFHLVYILLFIAILNGNPWDRRFLIYLFVIFPYLISSQEIINYKRTHLKGS